MLCQQVAHAWVITHTFAAFVYCNQSGVFVVSLQRCFHFTLCCITHIIAKYSSTITGINHGTSFTKNRGRYQNSTKHNTFFILIVRCFYCSFIYVFNFYLILSLSGFGLHLNLSTSPGCVAKVAPANSLYNSSAVHSW